MQKASQTKQIQAWFLSSTIYGSKHLFISKNNFFKVK